MKENLRFKQLGLIYLNKRKTNKEANKKRTPKLVINSIRVGVV